MACGESHHHGPVAEVPSRRQALLRRCAGAPGHEKQEEYLPGEGGRQPPSGQEPARRHWGRAVERLRCCPDRSHAVSGEAAMVGRGDRRSVRGSIADRIARQRKEMNTDEARRLGSVLRAPTSTDRPRRARERRFSDSNGKNSNEASAGSAVRVSTSTPAAPPGRRPGGPTSDRATATG
jgi:hypothetical protein